MKRGPDERDLFNNRVREKIRTLDLLIRSQTLYPAELHAHILVPIFSTKDTLSQPKGKVKVFDKF